MKNTYMTVSFHYEGEVWAHRTDLTPALCIVLRRRSERSHILVLGESIMPLTTIVCVIFLFSFLFISVFRTLKAIIIHHMKLVNIFTFICLQGSDRDEYINMQIWV